jgi:hypothetical protein
LQEKSTRLGGDNFAPLEIGSSEQRSVAVVPNPAFLEALQDGRQSAAALAICRGVSRLLVAHGFAPITEVPLANGRRADVIGVAESSEIWIVEIKSSLDDFRTDQKWHEYREYCDRLFFAVSPAFPHAVLPSDTGLIIADRYGGEIARAAPEHKLSGARRKALILRLVRAAALRLHAAVDPDIRLERLPNA